MRDGEAREVLGVAPGASRAEVRLAYRRAAKLAHPDHGGSESAFLRVRLAFEALLGLRRSDAVPPERPTPWHPDPIVVPVSPAMLRVGADVSVPIVRWVACGACSGVGTVLANRGRCTECRGAGQYSHGSPAFVLPCGPCHGTGGAAMQCKECRGSGRWLKSLHTTIRIKPDTNDGTVLRVPTLDGPAYVQLKAVNIRS